MSEGIIYNARKLSPAMFRKTSVNKKKYFKILYCLIFKLNFQFLFCWIVDRALTCTFTVIQVWQSEVRDASG